MAGTINNALVIRLESTASEAAVVDYTIPRAGKVVDITVIPTASVANATVIVGKGANVIATGLVAAVAGTIARATTLAQAYTTLAAGDVLRLTKQVSGANSADPGVTVIVSFAVDGAALASV